MEQALTLTRILDSKIPEDEINLLFRSMVGLESFVEKYGDKEVMQIINTRRALEYLADTSYRLPNAEDMLRLHYIFTTAIVDAGKSGVFRGGAIMNSELNNIFRQQVKVHMTQDDMSKCIRDMYALKPFDNYNEAVLKVILDWLLDFNYQDPLILTREEIQSYK